MIKRCQMILTVALALTASTVAYAVPEETLATAFPYIVEPYYELVGRTGSFEGVDGVKIGYGVFHPPFRFIASKGAIVLAVGRADAYFKHAELIFDLNTAGYSVYAWDHRGQGSSGRMLEDSQIGYVESFGDYVADMDVFVRTVVAKDRPHRLYALGVSMGGVIAALHAEEHPGVFDAIALAAPMFEIHTRKYPLPVARALATAHVLLGHGKEFATGQGSRDLSEPFEGNDGTHSRARFEIDQRLTRRESDQILGGPSFRWFQQAFSGMARAVRRAKDVREPVLLLQAGEDVVVRPRGQDRFCERAQACEKLVLENSRHGILIERDAVRDAALGAIDAFFGKY